MPTTMYHPSYGYHYATHPSLPPFPYYAGAWIPGHPVVHPPPAAMPDRPAKTDDMEEDGHESEEVASADITLKLDSTSKEQMKESLTRLVRVLRRFAKKGEGTIVDISSSS